MLLQVSIIPHTLQFKQPAGTSRGVYLTRKVWYVLIRSSKDTANRGIGECAPLPDLSCDALPDYEYILAKACRNLELNGTINTDELRPYPSILFGLETAMQHYKTGNIKLFDTPFSRGETGIPVNGLIWMGDYSSMLTQIKEKLSQGFRCIKLKIGAGNFDEELDLLKYIRKHYSKDLLEIRVDANGAFSPDEVLDKLNRLAEFDIHSIEQPIPAGQWTEMAELVSTTPLPIALDEELIGINSPDEKKQLLDTINPRYIILKPSLHGGMSGCSEWIEEARKRNIDWWVTSALESNIGLNAIAQWCSTFNNPLPQGLGTGKLFVENIDLPLQIRKDALWFDAKEYSLSKLPDFIKNEHSISINGKQYSKNNISQLISDNNIPVFNDLYTFLQEWFSESPYINIQTSGSTGIPKKITVRKHRMIQSARFTCERLNLNRNDNSLLCLPLQYIAGKMMVVRALAAGLNLIVRELSGHPLAEVEEHLQFAAMTPMQVYNSLEVPEETKRLKEIKTLIIGGSAIDDNLANKLKSFPNVIYSTYGMTETLSHIALRQLTGEKSSGFYVPFPSVKLSLSEDHTLCIDAPLIADEILTTNDLVRFMPNGDFEITGRKDNVINSGGIKLQIEEIENKIRDYIPGNFAITSVPDTKRGEAVVLLIEGNKEQMQTFPFLTKYENPKYVFYVDSIPLTATGKIDRYRCKQIAESLTPSLSKGEGDNLWPDTA